LENSFGAQFWGAAPGNSFGYRLWATTLDSFLDELAASGSSIGILWNLGNFFGTRFSVAILKSNLGNNCGEQFCGFESSIDG